MVIGSDQLSDASQLFFDTFRSASDCLSAVVNVSIDS